MHWIAYAFLVHDTHEKRIAEWGAFLVSERRKNRLVRRMRAMSNEQKWSFFSCVPSGETFSLFSTFLCAHLLLSTMAKGSERMVKYKRCQWTDDEVQVKRFSRIWSLERREGKSKPIPFSLCLLSVKRWRWWWFRFWNEIISLSLFHKHSLFVVYVFVSILNMHKWREGRKCWTYRTTSCRDEF